LVYTGFSREGLGRCNYLRQPFRVALRQCARLRNDGVDSLEALAAGGAGSPSSRPGRKVTGAIVAVLAVLIGGAWLFNATGATSSFPAPAHDSPVAASPRHPTSTAHGPVKQSQSSGRATTSPNRQ
jgi:hypothetical protein